LGVEHRKKEKKKEKKKERKKERKKPIRCQCIHGRLINLMYRKKIAKI